MENMSRKLPVENASKQPIASQLRAASVPLLFRSLVWLCEVYLPSQRGQVSWRRSHSRRTLEPSLTCFPGLCPSVHVCSVSTPSPDVVHGRRHPYPPCKSHQKLLFYHYRLASSRASCLTHTASAAALAMSREEASLKPEQSYRHG